MSHYSIRLDLLKLHGAFTRNLKGKTATKRCIIIPVDDNPNMYLGEKGCYLNLAAYETQNNQYGDTHMLKPDIPKEVRERMTDDERRAQPIIGNMKPVQSLGGTVSGTIQSSDLIDDNGKSSDLPF